MRVWVKSIYWLPLFIGQVKDQGLPHHREHIVTSRCAAQSMRTKIKACALMTPLKIQKHDLFIDRTCQRKQPWATIYLIMTTDEMV